MEFEQLLRNIRNYAGLCDDSRDVARDFVFVAGGGRDRAREYLNSALSRGAAVVVGEASLVGDVPTAVIVDDWREAAALLANEFYGHPSRYAQLIGVTGTCGKTTTTYLIEAIFAASGRKVGVIGTENIRYGGQILRSPNTTPSSIFLNRTLRHMVDAGCDTIAMEVSSHGIQQKRVWGLLFDAAVFTNLSLEHQDIHDSLVDYFATKAQLFAQLARKAIKGGKKFRAAVNDDDHWGKALFEACTQIAEASSGCYTVESFGRPRESAGGQDGIAYLSTGTAGVIDGVKIASSLIGEFNATNIAGAVCISKLLGVTDAEIARGVASAPPVPGRLETFLLESGAIAVVDYAHKPGALQVVMSALFKVTVGKMIVVFGCGGDRDKAKRPAMGKIATTGTACCVVTEDNCRSEPWESIRDEILSGIRADRNGEILVIRDRRDAIRHALAMSSAGDCVLVAGRGAESKLVSWDPMEQREIIVELDDRDEVRKFARSH